MEQKIKEEIKQQIAEMVANGLPASVGEIVIREGKAVEKKEPIKVCIEGTIDAAARWLETRFDCIMEKTCHVIVNREKLTITLQCNENNHYGTLLRVACHSLLNTSVSASTRVNISPTLKWLNLSR